MNKRGFTLIELLAVVVILAIIVLVTVPVLLNVIEKARIGSAESSVYGYIDAIEKQVVINKIKDNDGLLISEGEYTKADLLNKNVNVKGEITDALVLIDSKGRVVEGRFCINGYSIDYDGKKSVHNKEDNYCEELGSIIDACQVAAGTEYTFDYTGSEQIFNPPCKGDYKIELWGAQGGDANSTYIGGYGGYSVGAMTLNKTDHLYINVGGKGSLAHSPDTALGGYNGGGTGYAIDNRPNVQVLIYMGSGGGATHVALESGELPTLEQYKGELANNSYYVSDKILMVAGGGGGGNYYSPSNSHNTNGGAGGGYIGNSDVYKNGSRTITTAGGTQMNGGYMTDTANNYNFVTTFGKGGEWNSWSSGGGGGFYGGGAGYGSAVSGSGGSGYIASSKLVSTDTIKKSMYCYNCQESNEQKIYTVSTTGTNSSRDIINCPNGYSDNPISKCAKVGNGYARITYLGPKKTVTFNAGSGTLEKSTMKAYKNSKIGVLPKPSNDGYIFEGWYTEPDLINKIDENYIVTNNITLYAKWIDKLYLFKNGRFTNLTNWTSAPKAGWVTGLVSPVEYDDYILIRVTGTNQRSGYISTLPLDLSDYSKVYFDGYFAGGGSCSGAGLHIGTNSDPYFSSTMIDVPDIAECHNGGKSRIQPISNSRYTTSLDISSLNGLYYLSLEAMQCSNTQNVSLYAYNIWFEK